MPHKNASSPKKPYLDVNSSNKLSAMVGRLANQFGIKLGVATSLLATIYLPSSSKVVNATNLIPSKDTAQQNFARKTAPVLPRVFSVIASPVKSQLTNLSKVVLEEDSKSVLANRADKNSELNFAAPYLNTAHSVASMPGTNTNRDSYVATENKLPLSTSTSLIAQTPFKIYTVKPGDTVHQIAKRYQVSRSELVKLNKINNSNIIFVNQRLKIPTKAIDNTPLDVKTDEVKASGANLRQGSIHTHHEVRLLSADSSQGIKQKSTPSASFNLSTKATEENYPNPSKLDSNKVNSNSLRSTEDPHIVRLRAEIKQMRERERDRQKQKQANNTSSFSLPSKPSANHFDRHHLTRENIQNRSKQINLATSATPQDNLKPDLFPEETISLQLPPLPPSEEYLPNVFEGYIWPAEGVLTSGYGWRWGRLHRGIDIAAPVGTPVLAAASGKVINAGWHSGYGNLIKLEHLNGSITLYAHNNKILVSHGQKVDRGEQIAEMGSTGNSTGSHLHFEIYFKDRGTVNPLALLGSR